MYAVRRADDKSVRDLLPEGWEPWSMFAVRTLQKFGDSSPSVAEDAAIANALFPVRAG
jgi:hypothetical protein